MKPHRRKKLAVILFIALGLSAGIGLTAYALRQNINMFYTPTQIAAGEVMGTQTIRVGGMVKEGSIESPGDSVVTKFIATDYAADVAIYYEGRLPDLFREGQGVVVEGQVDNAGIFQASKVLAKHDENYMSQEVRAALDASDMSKPGYEKPLSGLPDDS